MRIIIFDIEDWERETEDWERETFERLSEHHELTLTSGSLIAENAAEYANADVISTFIYSDLNRDTLASLAGLKLIATRSTGYDHIDLEHCRDRDIAICNVPQYGTATVAE